MSSGDAILHAAASIGVRDGFKQLFPQYFDDLKERKWIRWGVVLLGIVAYYFAVISEVSLVALLLGAYGGVAQIFPLLVAAFYWKRATGAGALAGLLGGLLVNTAFLLFPEWKPFPLHEGIYGLIVNILLLIGVSHLTQQEKGKAEQYATL